MRSAAASAGTRTLFNLVGQDRNLRQCRLILNNTEWDKVFAAHQVKSNAEGMLMLTHALGLAGLLPQVILPEL